MREREGGRRKRSERDGKKKSWESGVMPECFILALFKESLGSAQE